MDYNIAFDFSYLSAETAAQIMTQVKPLRSIQGFAAIYDLASERLDEIRNMQSEREAERNDEDMTTDELIAAYLDASALYDETDDEDYLAEMEAIEATLKHKHYVDITDHIS